MNENGWAWENHEVYVANTLVNGVGKERAPIIYACFLSFKPRAHMRFWRLLPLKSFKKCFFSIEMGGMGKLEAVRRSICTDSEWRRRELIDYIQRVINGCFGTEVLSFGSVPLKTYLPDGDIDLTVLCHRNKEEELARAVYSLLEGEPKEPGFLVKDVRYVYAKV